MALIPDDALESIRSRVDIAELVKDYVPQLARAGRSFKARCPFHQERTPSFIVTPERQTFHCFGCGAGGDVFAFLMKMESLSFTEAAETAMHFGRGEVRIFAAEHLAEVGHYSRGLHSPKTGRKFRAATPALFSFNSPLGACPRCRGFGRVIEIDYRLAIPDRSLSIDAGALKCWEGAVYSSSLDDLRVFAKRRKIPTNIPFERLTPEQQAYVIDGEPGYGEENGKPWPKYWYGVKGFFRWLEKTTYKMHVRVFLSRYRSYNTCPDCKGARLQPEALCWKWKGFTLPELYAEPVDRLRLLLSDARPAAGGRQAEIAYDSIATRLGYLNEVGLGYLTPDRPSRTLSGGEVERVNLTGCLGTSLVDTLFVMDEPSVGLHPRDIDRLISIIRSLASAGNSVVVVEHDESMITAAEHVIERRDLGEDALASQAARDMEELLKKAASPPELDAVWKNIEAMPFGAPLMTELRRSYEREMNARFPHHNNAQGAA